MRAQRARVAITGVGMYTPAGHTAATCFETVLAARSVTRTITRAVDDTRVPTLACTVDDFSTEDYLSARELHGVDRGSLLGFCAATDAVRDAAPTITDDADRWGVVVGTGGAGL